MVVVAMDKLVLENLRKTIGNEAVSNHNLTSTVKGNVDVESK